MFIIFNRKVLYENSEVPDQTPCCGASDLGLHCLHSSQTNDAMLIRV